MKKWIIRGAIAVVALVVIVVVVITLTLDSSVKKAVEYAGPRLTQVDVKLDSVSLSLLGGSGKIKGLVVGNPEGYKTPSAISLGHASMTLNPGSVFSDKVIIKSIIIEAPEITFETNLRQSNIGKILANVESATGGSPGDAPATGESSTKKLQVDDVMVSGGQIHVSVTGLVGKTLTVPLPTIHLTGLGQGPEGITGAELAKRILVEVEKSAAQAAAASVADLSKRALDDLGKDAGKAATDSINKATKGLGDLFKK
jgi:hypothetical protein